MDLPELSHGDLTSFLVAVENQRVLPSALRVPSSSGFLLLPHMPAEQITVDSMMRNPTGPPMSS